MVRSVCWRVVVMMVMVVAVVCCPAFVVGRVDWF